MKCILFDNPNSISRQESKLSANPEKNSHNIKLSLPDIKWHLVNFLIDIIEILSANIALAKRVSDSITLADPDKIIMGKLQAKMDIMQPLVSILDDTISYLKFQDTYRKQLQLCVNAIHDAFKMLPEHPLEETDRIACDDTRLNTLINEFLSIADFFEFHQRAVATSLQLSSTLRTKLFSNIFISKSLDEMKIDSIPNKVHGIWIGSKLPLAYYLNFLMVCKRAAQHEINLWTFDEQVLSKAATEFYDLPASPRIHVRNIRTELYSRMYEVFGLEVSDEVMRIIALESMGASNYAAVADILRLIILFIHGGLYLDMDLLVSDVEGHTNKAARSLEQFFLPKGVGFYHQRETNCVIASAQGHPFTYKAINNLILAHQRLEYKRVSNVVVKKELEFGFPQELKRKSINNLAYLSHLSLMDIKRSKADVIYKKAVMRGLYLYQVPSWADRKELTIKVGVRAVTDLHRTIGLKESVQIELPSILGLTIKYDNNWLHGKIPHYYDTLDYTLPPVGERLGVSIPFFKPRPFVSSFFKKKFIPTKAFKIVKAAEIKKMDPAAVKQEKVFRLEDGIPEEFRNLNWAELVEVASKDIAKAKLILSISPLVEKLSGSGLFAIAIFNEAIACFILQDESLTQHLLMVQDMHRKEVYHDYYLFRITIAYPAVGQMILATSGLVEKLSGTYLCLIGEYNKNLRKYIFETECLWKKIEHYNLFALARKNSEYANVIIHTPHLLDKLISATGAAHCHEPIQKCDMYLRDIIIEQPEVGEYILQTPQLQEKLSGYSLVQIGMRRKEFLGYIQNSPILLNKLNAYQLGQLNLANNPVGTYAVMLKR